MQFLVEAYGTPGHGPDPTATGRRVESAGGATVRLVTAIGVPGDEVVFWLFEAPTRDAVVVALARAGVAADRISEASPTSSRGT